MSLAEIVDGEPVTSPRPALPHTLAASAIGSIPFVGREGVAWMWIVDSPSRMDEVYRLASEGFGAASRTPTRRSTPRISSACSARSPIPMRRCASCDAC